MISVLLVDDEYSILEALKALIDWESHGFCIIDTASTAKDAYEKICFLKPDVVITDIRLPDLTGIELLNMIKRSFPSIKSIVISGYQDFEYARETVKCGAFNYLVKPVNQKELTDTLMKVAKSLQKTPGDKIDEHIIEESVSVLRSRFLYSLVNGEISSIDIIRNRLFEFNISFDFKVYYMIIVDLDFLDIKDRDNTLLKDNMELIKFASSSIMEETLQRDLKCIVFYLFDNKVIAIMDAENFDEKYIDFNVKKIQHNISNFLKMPITIGISRMHKGLQNLPNSYKEARTTLKYKLLFGKNTIINYRDVLEFMADTFKAPVEIEKKIVSSVIYNDKSIISSLVDNLFQNIICQKASPEEILQECSDIISIINRNTSEMGIDINKNIYKYNADLGDFIKQNSVVQLKDFFTNMLFDISGCILEKMSDNYKNIVSQICSYINTNYSQEITLNKISEKFFVSPSYVSRLFKEHTSDNFVDYINKIRINEAKKLLDSTNLKIYEVSDKVGYTNPKYFSQIFQKVAGLSPKEYRIKFKKV